MNTGRRPPVSPLVTDAWVNDLVSGCEPDLQLAFRIGIALRELRRASSMTALRERLYGGGPEALELGQVDTLALLVLGGPVRMAELAERLRVDPSAATRAVDRLKRIGLARRTTDVSDGRAIVVSATDRGRERYREIAERQRELIFKVLSSFDPGERETLASLLERFVMALDDEIGAFAGPVAQTGGTAART